MLRRWLQHTLRETVDIPFTIVVGDEERPAYEVLLHVGVKEYYGVSEESLAHARDSAAAQALGELQRVLDDEPALRGAIGANSRHRVEEVDALRDVLRALKRLNRETLDDRARNRSKELINQLYIAGHALEQHLLPQFGDFV